MVAKILWAAVLLVMVSGCATWVHVRGEYVDDSLGYEVQLPAEWRKYNFARKCLFLTKDGIPIQQLIIGRLPRDEALRNSQRVLSEDLLPQEVAEAVVADISVNPMVVTSSCLGGTRVPSPPSGFLDYRVLENLPTTVGQYPGFKLVYTYKEKSGLRRQAAHYGVLVGDFYYYLHFEAPARHYFPKDYPTFENVKSTFQIRTGAS